MDTSRLVRRGLTYYWRTHLAVVLGVATAVAVLAGALLVGDSVRGSLRDLVLGRLGATDHVIASPAFFREQLAADIAQEDAFEAAFTAAAPLIVAPGIATNQETGRRVGQVRVYGVDDRFWEFHHVERPGGSEDRAAFVSEALASELGIGPGGAVLLRVQRPTDLPLESLHSRKDDLGRTLRLPVAEVLPPAALGEFSLEAQQGEVRAAFVPLALLQRQIETPGLVNTILVSARPDSPPDAVRALERIAASQAQLEDLGLSVTALDDRGVLVVGSDAGLIDEPRAAVVRDVLAGLGWTGQPLFTYVANSLQSNGREIPYSLVTALDLDAIAPDRAPAPAGASEPPIVLNEWAAAELAAGPGDRVAMEYYVWEEPGQLVTRMTAFRIAAIVPIAAGDRDMAPAYPGITDSPTLDDWDPPFPVDLSRIRPQDEAYWEAYRTTPKAFIPLDAGQRLWRSRHGALTSIRVAPAAGPPLAAARDTLAAGLRAAIDPLALGLAVRDVRAESLEASRGATDFGAYFVYFSFFLVVSALLLAALFFKLGVEQRMREVGLLRAVGFGPAGVRRLFLGEGLLLSLAGSVLGVAGALAYAWLIMLGLRSWWVGAVNTTALTLHVSWLSLIAGAAGGVLAAAACIWWTLRSLGRISERSLLMGELAPGGLQEAPRAATRGLIGVGAALVVAAAALLGLALGGWASQAGAFFGAGSALLGASLCLFLYRLRRQPRSGLAGHGWGPVSRLGLRNAAYRPGRSVLSIAVIASATFILIAVDAFRRGDTPGDTGPRSGLGGYDLLVETLLPVVHDPNTEEGREALNLFTLDPDVSFEPFRLLPGDDASCLNLYQPRNPRILAPRDSFLAEGRFAFQDSLATTDEERANPWLLLQRELPDGAIPVIADANSLTYVLHLALGEDLVIARGGHDIRLRVVAALRDSIFQGELLMSQDDFVRLFPEQEGYRVLLVDAPGTGTEAAAEIENALIDFGAGATGTAERLAQFHQVENTYLSTFQTLGGLGLLLGTVGLATVLLRNVLERRRELALLAAVGYRRGHVLVMTVAESVLLLAGGLLAGAVSAGLAIAPAVEARGGRFPLTGGALLLLFAVFLAGLLSSMVAVRAATRAPVLASLRSE